jgi:hypothetical protein
LRSVFLVSTSLACLAGLGLVELHLTHVLCAGLAASSLCRGYGSRRRSHRRWRGRRGGSGRSSRRGHRGLCLSPTANGLLSKHACDLGLQGTKRTTHLSSKSTKKSLYLLDNRGHSTIALQNPIELLAPIKDQIGHSKPSENTGL